MISMPPSVSPATYAVASLRVSSRPRARRMLVVLFTFLAVLLGGAGSFASAQTAHFSGALSGVLSGTAVGSGFNYPTGVAVDGSGDVFVADYMNNAVKEVIAVNGSIPASPIIMTLGSGFSHPAALALDSSGNLYVADNGNNAVKEILAVNGSIPALPTIRTLTTFTLPNWVAVDTHGNVYVSGGCSGSMCTGSVEMLQAVNGSIPSSPNVVVFRGSMGFPSGLAVDSSGDLFVADEVDNCVWEILAINGSISTSSTMKVVASFPGSNGPTGLALDGSGNLFVADSGTNTIYEIPAANGSIPPLATPITFSSGFNDPFGISVGAKGDVYVANLGSNSVERIALSIGNFGAVNIGVTSPVIPMAFTFDTAGTLGSTAVLTQGATGLDFVDAGSDTCTTNTAYAAGQTCTVNVAFMPKFAGIRSGAVVLYDTAGNAVASGSVQGTGIGPQIAFLPGTLSAIGNGFKNPDGVAVDGSGNIYVTDFGNNTVKEILAVNGRIPASPTIRVLGSGFNQPYSVALDGSGNVYFADAGNNAVKEIVAINGSIPSSPAIVTLGSGFNRPFGVVVDRAGNVFVADTGNSAIKEIIAVNGSIPASPTIQTLQSNVNTGFVAVDGGGNVYFTLSNFPVVELLAVNGSFPASPAIKFIGAPLSYPFGLAIDGSGNIYVANNLNTVSEIHAVNGSIPSSPTVTTLSSAFNIPASLAVDSSGNIYIADGGNNRIAKLDFADPPSLTFAAAAVGSTSIDSPQVVTIENIGNAPLKFPIPSIGNNPSIGTNFTLGGSSTCPVLSPTSYQAGILAPGASCSMPISFAPTVSGAISSSLVLTDNNLNAAAPGYTTQSIALSGTGTQTKPKITWATPAPISYGTPLSETQLNAASTVPGTFTYSPEAGIVLTAGQQTLTVAFVPTDTTDYTTATATVMLNVKQTMPAFTWVTPAAITYGTPLSATQLNASSPVDGTFTYSPAAGAMLTAGQQMLTANFTPTDTTDYTTAAATVTLIVNQATPTITWTTPSSIPYGTPLSATQLNANSPEDGTFTYSPAAGTVLNAGSQTLTLIFTPTDTTDYAPTTASMTLTVNRATPTITWTTPSSITYGTPLSASQLNAIATVAGNFDYSPAVGTLLGAGQQTLMATFTPTDTTNHTSATASVILTVNKATPVIFWATPATIIYGTQLSKTQLNASSPVAGTFSYSPAAGTVLVAGAQTLKATFAPTDITDYTTAAATVTLTVNKATPTIAWATPAAITYGTPLSRAQLNASSTLAGKFTYSPATGTVLAVGADTLSVTFAPTDTVDYSTASASVMLTVNPAPSFTLGASPAWLTVARGASGKSTIAVSKLNGFTGSVTLAASGMPTGVRATFTTNPTTGSSILTLTASTSAATGSTTVTIKGTSGSLTASTTIALTVSCTPTTITPYISINGGSTWTQQSSATVKSPSTVVDLGPQPANGGSWSWTGPNKYTSTSRQINSIPLTVGTDLYVASYTNTSGCKSTQNFTITVK